jgi:hypothetical protein
VQRSKCGCVLWPTAVQTPEWIKWAWTDAGAGLQRPVTFAPHRRVMPERTSRPRRAGGSLSAARGSRLTGSPTATSKSGRRRGDRGPRRRLALRQRGGRRWLTRCHEFDDLRRGGHGPRRRLRSSPAVAAGSLATIAARESEAAAARAGGSLRLGILLATATSRRASEGNRGGRPPAIRFHWRLAGRRRQRAA